MAGCVQIDMVTRGQPQMSFLGHHQIFTLR